MVKVMPAVRYRNGFASYAVVNFLDPGYYHRFELVTRPDQGLAIASCVGFICNAGAAFLPDAKLGKARVLAITSGDGAEDSEWRPVAEDEYVYCMVINRRPPDRRADYECYVLVDDFGWPILTTRKRESQTSCGPEDITEGCLVPKRETWLSGYGGDNSNGK